MKVLAIRWILTVLCLCWGSAAAPAAQSEQNRTDNPTERMWNELLAGAASLHLPTGFLKAMPADFVRFEFDDLRTYAAEYHPGDHRMVLNRPLSFNAAGRTLRPFAKMAPKEIEVLYHELFHAYMDWLVFRARDPAGRPDPLLAFARAQQSCRYVEVAITPVPQRPRETELRYLTEGEAWEALNETWAVFIGWAVWNQLELQRAGGGALWQQPRLVQLWQDRLRDAVKRGDLRGYYVPEDPEERRVTQKRILAGSSQISVQELSVLMKQAIGLPDEFIGRTEKLIAPLTDTSKRACSGGPVR
jgi:hypothetical protein